MHRRFVALAGVAAAAALVPVPTAASAPPARLGTIAEFAVQPLSRPLAIVAGPDGALWFTEIGAARIGRMTVDGVLTGEWPTPTPNSQPDGIAIGRDGDVWFAEVLGNRIGRLDVETGGITEYRVPTPDSRPTEVTVAADGRVWFTERGTAGTPGEQIGVVDSATGEVTEYAVHPRSRPLGIVAGPDGDLWFTESAANQIGRLDPSGGRLTAYPLPEPNRQPWEPTVGPDGAIWFTEVLGNRIGRLTADGALTEYELPAPGSGPNVIVPGPDPNPAADCRYQRDADAAAFFGRYGSAFGRCVSHMAQTESLWFAETLGNRIGRITTSGVITEFAIPSPGTQPVGVAAGPDGNVWFAESAATTGDRIGRLLAR